MTKPIVIRVGLERDYADIYTAEALGALGALSPLNRVIKLYLDPFSADGTRITENLDFA